GLGRSAGIGWRLLGGHALRRQGHADLVRPGLELLDLALEVADTLVLGRGLGHRSPGPVSALLDVGAEALDLALHLLDRPALLPHHDAQPAVLLHQVAARRTPGEHDDDGKPSRTCAAPGHWPPATE